jgi:O-antigen/teichoic acid export membrane protein
MTLLLIRYSGLFLLFFSYLLVAGKMEVAEYGEVTFALLAASLISLLRLGAHTGYVNFYFNKKLKDNDYLRKYYTTGSILHLVFNGFCVLGLSHLFNLELESSLILYFALIFYYTMEPILRVREKYFIISIDKLIAALYIIFMYFTYEIITTSLFLKYYLAGYLTYYVILICFYYRYIGISLDIMRDCSKYLQMIKEGFFINLNTVLFTAIISFDMVVVKYYFTAEVLGNYGLTKQILNGALYFFTSIALVQSNKIGSLIHEPESLNAYVERIWRLNFIQGIGIFCALLAVGEVIDTYFVPYNVSTNIMIIGFFYILSGAVNSSSTVLFLRQKSRLITVCLVFMISLFSAISAFVMKGAESIELFLYLYSSLLFIYIALIFINVKREIRI